MALVKASFLRNTIDTFSFLLSFGLIWTPWSTLHCWHPHPSWHSFVSIDCPPLTPSHVYVTCITQLCWSRYVELHLVEFLGKWWRLIDPREMERGSGHTQKYQSFVGKWGVQTGLGGCRQWENLSHEVVFMLRPKGWTSWLWSICNT